MAFRDTDKPFSPDGVWVLTNAHPGNRTQAIGLAEALEWDYEVKELHFTPWSDRRRYLPFLPLSAGLDRQKFSPLQPPWPDLVIGVGRSTAPVTRWISRVSQGRTRTVQIGRGGGAVAERYDAVITPRHCRLPPDAKRYELLLSLNPLSSEQLAEAGRQWPELLDGAPRPVIALLVGGDASRFRLSAADAAAMAATVRSWAEESGGSVIALTSRRRGGVLAETDFVLNPERSPLDDTLRIHKRKDPPFMSTRFFIPQDGNSGARYFLRRYLQRRRPVPEFPRILQIQTQSGCNALCRFCPNESTRERLSMGRMDEDLFRRIIDEAVRHPVKRISPYLMNEPLADPRLPDLIRYISERKARMTRTKINTNASYLDEEMGGRLIESGLDRLHVSFHGIRKETYEASMGNMSWEKNLANVNRFIELKRRSGAKNPKLKITMVHTQTIDRELEEIREYWNSRGITVNIHALENRSHGAVEERRLNILPMRALSDCDRLMQQAYILWNGDCVLCCVDWERTTIMGNTAEEGLQKVWRNEKYMQYRRGYLAGEVEGTLCAGCKVQNEVDFTYRPRVSLHQRLRRKKTTA